jgi:hypothetical protein
MEDIEVGKAFNTYECCGETWGLELDVLSDTDNVHDNCPICDSATEPTSSVIICNYEALERRDKLLEDVKAVSVVGYSALLELFNTQDRWEQDDYLDSIGITTSYFLGLSGAFIFADTEQGHEFWCGICDSIDTKGIVENGRYNKSDYDSLADAQDAYVKLVAQVKVLDPDAATYLMVEAPTADIDFDYTGSLIEAFDWDRTPQGIQYWDNIYESLG